MAAPQPDDVLVARLRAAGCVFAEQEAGLLAAAADDPERLAHLVDRRVSGIPLEQVLGWADFCGRRVTVAEGVFVPRRRTALLVDESVRRAPVGGTVVELCCGSGAVSAAVLARRPDLRVLASDVDAAATACAARNLGADRVRTGDLFAPLPDHLRQTVDVVVANAPYVPTHAIALMPPEARLHERRVALDGGPDGLDVQRRIAAGAAGWLRPGGALVLETSRAQAKESAELLRRNHFTAAILRDDEIDATAVVGTLTEPIPPAMKSAR